MNLRSLTLTLPNELLSQLQQIATDNPEAMNQFVSTNPTAESKPSGQK
jgi:hypothetical protein